MSHFVKVIDGAVVDGIVATQAEINSERYGDAFLWIQTSYNGNFRKNYAGVGYTYDPQRDAFIPPKPYSSWILIEDTCLWEPPVPMPEEGQYMWDEDTINWVETTGVTNE
jgi:hypothetical protein